MENGQLDTDQLSINQLRWLSRRAWYETDQECLKACGLGASTVSRWRHDQPHFVEAEKSIWRGDIVRTQEIMARLRDRAVLVLEGLLASRDVRTRRAAATDILDRAGMARGDVVTVQVSGALKSLLKEASKDEEAEDG